MKKILFLLVTAGLFLACEGNVAEEAKSKAAERFTLKQIGDSRNGDKNFDRGDLDGTRDWNLGEIPSRPPEYGLAPDGAGDILPDWAIGDKSTISFVDTGSEYQINYSDNLLKDIIGTYRLSRTAAKYYNTTEKAVDDSVTVARIISVKKSWDFYSGVNLEYKNHNITSPNIDAITVSHDTIHPDVGPVKRVSFMVELRATDGTFMCYVWKGFVNGDGKIDIQLVGFERDLFGISNPNEISYGDVDMGAPYKPMI